MHSEIIISDVKEKLGELGFALSSIFRDVKTISDQMTVDLLVYNNEVPWIAVEIVDVVKLAKATDYARFDPRIRKLQSYSNSINAPFFLLTDGKEYVWFVTDDETGRPKQVQPPVILKTATSSSNSVFAKEKASDCLKALRQYLGAAGKETRDLDAGYIILRKLLEESGDDSFFKIANWVGDREYELWRFFEEKDTVLDYENRSYLKVAYDIISQVQLSEVGQLDLLELLDRIFLNSDFKSYHPRTPRWLSDLLVEFSMISADGTVLDLSCGYGDILAASVLKRTYPHRAYGIASTSEQLIWSKIQQIIAGFPENKIFIGDPHAVCNEHQIELSTISNVISTPLFGNRKLVPDSYFMDYSNRVNHYEDYLISNAIDIVKQGGKIVIIVPEGFLFSEKRAYFRNYIHHKSIIRAVISLQSGLILPYTSAKTSILVLEKGHSKWDHSIFMAHLDFSGEKDTFNCRDIPNVSRMLHEYELHCNRCVSDEAQSSWTVPIDAIDLRNLTVNHYSPSKGGDDVLLGVPRVKIKDIARIERSSAVKLDPNGDIPVIGPSAVRPFEIDPISTGLTSRENLSSRTLRTEIDDILVNNISTHLGAAALVDENTANYYLSQHVVKLSVLTNVLMPAYLVAALNSKHVRDQALKSATGTIMPALTISRLGEIEIPMPDIDTQQRVITNIVKIKKKLDDAKRNLDKAERDFKNIVDGLTMVGGER